MLYTAIVSNSVNFKSSLTTDRDKKMAQWLETFAKPDAGYMHEYYKVRSNFTKPIFEHIDDDFTYYTLSGQKVGITQLEILDAENFFQKNHDEISNVLSKLKEKYALDHILFNCVDIELGFSFIFCKDQETRDLISHALDIAFENDIAHPDKIFMRKQIGAKLKEELEK